jgi:DNA-binding beta-propeller fold protein YncE
MNKRLSAAAAALLVFLAVALPAAAALEWSVVDEWNLDGPPVDVAFSQDGARAFVLLEGGRVIVYGARGTVEERLTLDFDADGIALSPAGDRLYATSGPEKKVRVVSLDYIQRFSLEGSPFKGPEGATVAVTVFDDFQ